MSRTVEIKRSGATAKDDPNCFNRLHWALPPVAKANPGDYIIYETRDAFDDQFGSAATPADVAGADLTRVHPMTGPVLIEGAKRGDALAVTVVDIAPNDYGYTAIAPGFGFLRDVITGPFIVNWKLDRLAAVSDQLPNICIPMCAFPGSIGVLPGKPEVAEALDREGALAAAGGFVLMPEPNGAVPAALFADGAPWAGDRRHPFCARRRRGMWYCDRDGGARHAEMRGRQKRGVFDPFSTCHWRRSAQERRTKSVPRGDWSAGQGRRLGAAASGVSRQSQGRSAAKPVGRLDAGDARRPAPDYRLDGREQGADARTGLCCRRSGRGSQDRSARRRTKLHRLGRSAARHFRRLIAADQCHE